MCHKVGKKVKGSAGPKEKKLTGSFEEVPKKKPESPESDKAVPEWTSRSGKPAHSEGIRKEG